MKAWRFYGFNDMRLDDVPDPVPRQDHVVVEVLCIQPSVTEAQLAHGIPTVAYDDVKRKLETEAPVQLFGHEFCARVIEAGPKSRFQAGDRVAARAKLPCLECSLCQAGRGELCRDGPIVGFQLPGCFSERALLPELALVKVDDRISDSEGACLQSLSDSLAAVDTAGIKIGDTVAVFGQGSMGLECMQVARASGAGKLITVDVRDESCRKAPTWFSSAPAGARSRDWPGLERWVRRPKLFAREESWSAYRFSAHLLKSTSIACVCAACAGSSPTSAPLAI